jgi:hypothetical protein
LIDGFQVSMTNNAALRDLTLVDTPGVMPGQAESRGYAFIDVVKKRDLARAPFRCCACLHL